MKRALTAEQMREVDRAAGRLGMAVSVLMENAGTALAEEAARLAGPQGRFLVLCGGGNNGGDGRVAARKLAMAGKMVWVETLGQVLEAAGPKPAPIARDVAVGPGDVVVDALLGTGLSRAPEGAYADAIARIESWRARGAKVLAADVPSGLHSDTGQPFASCVRADVTLAFGALKVGQVLEPGASQCGDVRVADIGIPGAALEAEKGPSVLLLEESDVRERLPVRRADSHKGTYGHVLVVAGSWGKTGAAALAAQGALRAGAGLVTVATRPEALVPVMGHAPEIMGVELVGEGALGLGDLSSLVDAIDGKSALVLGPGIPRGEETAKLLAALLEDLAIPCVLDADGLNAIGGKLDVLRQAKGPLVLTPHPGEMARLLGIPVGDVQKDRVRAARALATEHHVVVLLKGARSVIALEDGAVYVNPTGNPGMATGGTGDVLAGVCGALLAQGLSPEDAARVGAYAHGLAGDLVAAQTGQMGLIASDLLSGLGQVWVRWGR